MVFDEAADSLSTLLDNTDGFPCLMYWPQDRSFKKVELMRIKKENAKFLEVMYLIPHGNEGKTEEVYEKYNLLELHMCSLNKKAGQGIQGNL